MRVRVKVGVCVLVDVGDGGTGMGDVVTVGDVAKTTDVAVGSAGLWLVQLASPNNINSNVRLDAMN
jgi:hypothetical protein